MKKILALSILFIWGVSREASAFHAVTEILPGGQMLICEDDGQTKKDEFPNDIVGKKISLFHRDFHLKRKILKEFHEVKIGNAIVVDSQSLVGAIRAKNKITIDEAVQIDKSCVVAIAEKNVVVDEFAAVYW